MSGNVKRKVLVLEFFLFRRLCHVQSHHTLRQRALDVEVHIQMLSASSVLGHNRRNVPVSCPAIPRALSVCSDLLRVPQDVNAPFILLDAAVGLAEMICLAVGAEDFLVEEPAYAAGCHDADEDESKIEGLLCAPRELFSGGELSPWDAAIVAGECDGFASGARRVSYLVMGGIVSAGIASEGSAVSEESVEDGFWPGY